MIEDRCKDIVEALTDYALGGLPSEDHEIVAAHLAACTQCRAMDSGLRSLPAMLRSALDSTLDAKGTKALAQDALDSLVATVDERVRETLRRSLSPADEAALTPGEERKKA